MVIRHDAAASPKTMKIIATKAPRHKEFIYNKPFCVTLCLGVLVAIFIAGPKVDFLPEESPGSNGIQTPGRIPGLFSPI